jgi:hypothetical protein
VEDDVDGPGRDIGDSHGLGPAHDIPEHKEINRDGRRDDGPRGRAEALNAVSDQADEAADGERLEDIQSARGNVETGTPRKRCEENRDIEKDDRWKVVEHNGTATGRCGVSVAVASRSGEAILACNFHRTDSMERDGGGYLDWADQCAGHLKKEMEKK